MPVGWSDHTLGLTSAVVAVALGATVLEKHVTTDRNLPGPDHAASLEPDELTDYVIAVRDASASLGDGIKRRMPAEVENASLVRRSWHAARDLPPGHTVGGRRRGHSAAGARSGSRDSGCRRAGDPSGPSRRPDHGGRRGARVKVAVFIGTRADLGPLQPVLAELTSRPEVETIVLTGLAFDAAGLAERVDRAVSSVIALAAPIGEVDLPSQLRHGPAMSAGASRVVAEHPVDRLVVLGDRWELLYVVPPFVLAGVPVVHLHGGEVTSGAIDERVRHAVTKLADVHCVASQDSADRVAQLGEEPERIHVTGAPGLDRYATLTRLDDAELEGLLGRAGAATTGPVHLPPAHGFGPT